jgi:hypothetical protein
MLKNSPIAGVMLGSDGTGCLDKVNLNAVARLMMMTMMMMMFN